MPSAAVNSNLRAPRCLCGSAKKRPALAGHYGGDWRLPTIADHLTLIFFTFDHFDTYSTPFIFL